MSSQGNGGKTEWPLVFPPYRESIEYLYHIEYAHPALYEGWINELKDGINVLSHNIEGKFLKHGTKVGLVKPIFVETSEEEAYVVTKLWSPLEEEYKWPQNFDIADLFWFMECSKYVGGLN